MSKVFENEFCSLQNVISQEDIFSEDAYKKYDGILKNKNKKMIGIGEVATATVTVATGGLAWTLAIM